MHAGARQADKDAKLGRRPLRGWRIAVAAEVVLGFLLEGGKLGWTSAHVSASPPGGDVREATSLIDTDREEREREKT